MPLLLTMSAATVANRPRSGFLENPALWDTGSGATPGPVSGGHPVDQLAHFAPAILNVRWATTAVGIVLASPAIVNGDLLLVAAGLVLVGYAVYRTAAPLSYTGSPSDQALLLGEVALFAGLMSLTGFWQSPLTVPAAAGLIVAGFAGGFRLALYIGGSTCLALTVIASSLTPATPESVADSIQGASLLLLAAVVAAYGRRISGEAHRRTSAQLDRISQLTDANTLLYNLHRLAQTLPASLDRLDVLDSSLSSLRGLLDYDRAAVLLVEPSDQTWYAATTRGMDFPAGIEPALLPEPAQEAIVNRMPVIQPVEGLAGGGAHSSSRGGLYAPLTARDRLIGLVLLESSTLRYDERDRRTVSGFIEPMSLAVDNATLFGRIRQASVDEERSRIARELHDRVGQLLASLGFEVDRLLRHDSEGRSIGAGLAELREGIRSLTGEVRDTLYDLRSDVSEGKDFEATMTEFARRVTDRSGMTVTVEADASARLPLRQEREMWRIAQEALINVERHADADSATVRWRCDDHQAFLEVIDDGRGMDADRTGRIDSYGIVGMRERASGVGAALEIVSSKGEGTTVRCYLSQI
jgi:signal transduction histidine kinase